MENESLRISMIKLCSVFLFFLLTVDTHAQSAWKSFWSLSGPEKCWVITHPFIANKARKVTAEARTVSGEMKSDSLLDGDADGGRVDAFRHAYWMARLSQTFCWKKAIRLGKAHEKGNFKDFKKGRNDEESVLPDSASTEMDLFNNNIGAQTGCENPELKGDELKRLIIEKIIKGEMRIISKNQQFLPLDCEGKTIDLKLYSGRWNIPKCLIPSGF